MKPIQTQPAGDCLCCKLLYGGNLTDKSNFYHFVVFLEQHGKDSSERWR